MDRTPQTEMEAHDKAKRLEVENDILSMAQSLTNGHKGDLELEGKVRLWQVRETIENGRMLRTIIESLRGFQLRDDCVLAHSGKVGTVIIFGQTYKVPMTVLITCWFAWKLAVKFEPVLLELSK